MRCTRLVIYDFLSSHSSNTENRSPVPEKLGRLGRRVAKASGGKGAFGPAVGDASEVPFYYLWSSIAVELVTDVD